MGAQGYGIDSDRLNSYAEQITALAQAGVEVGIVIGGGNIFRGLSGAAKGFDRVKGDQMGMLATVINSLALSSALEAAGCRARVLTSIGMFPVGEPYSPMRAIETLSDGTVAIIAGGTGNPDEHRRRLPRPLGDEVETAVHPVDQVHICRPRRSVQSHYCQLWLRNLW